MHLADGNCLGLDKRNKQAVPFLSPCDSLVCSCVCGVILFYFIFFSPLHDIQLRGNLHLGVSKHYKASSLAMTNSVYKAQNRDFPQGPL